MLKRNILYIAGLFLLAAFSPSCEVITGPNFPDEPKISFRDIKKYRITKLSNAIDSISIAVKFQDGNGDLGLTQEEINSNPPPNYHITAYQQVNGEWILKDYNPSLSGSFPILNPGKEGPIEGTLSYGPIFPIFAEQPNTVLKFEVYILDRAGNISNTIVTSEITINEK